MRVASESRMESVRRKLTCGPVEPYCARASTMGFISRFLFVLILVFGATSRAGDAPKIVVIPFTLGDGSPEASPGRFTSQVTEELRGRDDAVELVGAPAVAKGEKPSNKS